MRLGGPEEGRLGAERGVAGADHVEFRVRTAQAFNFRARC